MTGESQSIEYKESWNDDYLKWICGFANAQGGILYIGKDDKGRVVGVKNAKKLMEDIPNKVRDILGIIVDVNLLSEEGKEYLEIVVNSYPYGVNYKGEYHYRSGSTKQVLKGPALNRFLLQKQGITWDSTTVPGVSLQDFREDSFSIFRELALVRNRLSKEDLAVDNLRLLENLDQPIVPETSQETRQETGVETGNGQKTGIEIGIENEIGQKIGIEQYQSLPIQQRRILVHIVQNEMMTITELAEKLGMARSTITLHINQLKQHNLVAREGSTKKGRWVILKQGKSPKEGN